MKQSIYRWADWIWNPAIPSCDPLALNTPGQIIYIDADLFSSPMRWGLAHSVNAMALLCPQTYFMIAGNHPVDMLRFYNSDPAPYIQAHAGAILLNVANKPLLRPFRHSHLVGCGERMSGLECRLMGQRMREGAMCAGIGIPLGAPLLSNVWLGVDCGKYSGVAFMENQLRALVATPVAQRFVMTHERRASHLG